MVLNESYYKLDIVKKYEEIKKQNIELCYLLDEAIKIIKEARKYIESYLPNYDFDKTNLIKLLEILDKENE